MTIWRRVPLKLYPIIAIVGAIGIGFWNYSLITADARPLESGAKVEDIRFTLNSGEEVALPGTSQLYRFLILWSIESERSNLALAEAAQLIASAEHDTIAQFYLVNVSDSLSAIREAVNFDNLALPYGYAPTGDFMERYQLRSLPVIIILSPEGLVMGIEQGYSEGLLRSRVDQIAKLRAIEQQGAAIRMF